MQDEIKTVSFGGLGDAVLVGYKLDLLRLKNVPCKINHLFVESNEKTLKLIKEYIESQYCSSNFSFGYEFDKNYVNNFKKWNNRRRVNTTWNGKYHEPSPNYDGLNLLEYDFVNLCHHNKIIMKKYKYDVCIQVAGGVGSNRQWNFNPLKLAQLLKLKYKVVLIGTDENYKNIEDEDNLVCKTSLIESVEINKNSKCFVGLSGFHNYVRHYLGLPHIHLRESLSHDYHYYCPKANNNRYSIKYGTLPEVISALKKQEIVL